MAVMQTASNISLKRESAAAARQPTRIQRKAVERAHEYNQRLADSGQLVLGEAPDPFSNDTTSASLKDEDYQSALNMDGDGMMGSISIPKINVNLPIWHGTSAKSLENGAGHMYGTSLPVGGESTHSVISAHNGMPNVLMFTYLDQMVIGDVFYIHVAGTDGKGSVCAMTESILKASGLRVGAFTSPHIMRVNECIRVDGEVRPLTDELRAKVDLARERMDQLRETLNDAIAGAASMPTVEVEVEVAPGVDADEAPAEA